MPSWIVYNGEEWDHGPIAAIVEAETVGTALAAAAAVLARDAQTFTCPPAAGYYTPSPAWRVEPLFLPAVVELHLEGDTPA